MDEVILKRFEQPEVFFCAVETFLKGRRPPAAKKLQAAAIKE
jgi:hypothetical protein